MRLLALDIGNRRTGIAYLDEDVGVPLPLTTLTHKTPEELLPQIEAMIRERKIDRVIIGLPRLLDGTEGTQAGLTRAVAEQIKAFGVEIRFVDERYTSPQIRTKKALRHSPPPSAYDGDAAAACAFLLMQA
jgi:putative Holliday junction resolvase